MYNSRKILKVKKFRLNMTEENLIYELEYLGFTTNEAKVYLTLLKIGRAQAGRIAKECRLERTSTYNALKKLTQEGVVASVIESNKQVFSVGEPEKIRDIFKEKEERAIKIIPQLQELKKFEREKENIIKFRGYAGIKTVFNDILNSCGHGEEYLIFGSENQLSQKMPVYAEIYVARKDKKKLRARILMNKKFKKIGHKMSKYTEVKYVPKEVRSFSNINIYKNKVAILIWSEIPEAIIIDNKETTDSFRSYFEFMWKSAKK